MSLLTLSSADFDYQFYWPSQDPAIGLLKQKQGKKMALSLNFNPAKFCDYYLLQNKIFFPVYVKTTIY